MAGVRSGQGPGRFETVRVLEDATGVRHVWHSRRNRKGLDPERESAAGRSRPRAALAFEPTRITWWIGVLFMTGASLFAVGSMASAMGLRFADRSDWILFTGSIFFTSAAYLQLLEVNNEPALDGRPPSFAWFRWEPHKIGWWAVAVQFVGTLLFNVNTFAGTRTLGPAAEEVAVWLPNALGSICFLVASYLAYAEVCNRWFGWQPRNISWWVVVINLLGSLAFGVSAVQSFVLRGGGVVDARGADLSTFVGAVCFFVAAYLLLPEMTAHHRSFEEEGLA